MKQKHQKIVMEVTEDEEELLAAIRNYIKSYPDGEPELRWYAEKLFNIMMESTIY